MRLPELVNTVKAILSDPLQDGLIVRYCNAALQATADAVLLPGLEVSAQVTVPAGAEQVALPADYHRNLFQVRPVAGGRDLDIVESRGDIDRLRVHQPAGGQIRVVAAIGTSLHVYPAPAEDSVLLLEYTRRPHALALCQGAVTFKASAKTLTATSPIFGPFVVGDVFAVVGSAQNDRTYTITAVNSFQVTVAEAVVDEASGSLVNVLAEEIEGVLPELHYDVLVAYALKLGFARIEDALDGAKPNTDRHDALFEKGCAKLRLAFRKRGLRASIARPDTAHIRSLA